MKVDKKDLDKSQVELTITISPEEFKPYYEKAAANISKDLKIEGFRPGKVPRHLVEKHVGTERVFEEAIKVAIPDTLVKAVKQEKVEAIGQPEITPQKIATGNDFVYKAKMAVLPEFELPDYTKIKVERKPVKIDDKDVIKVLDDLGKSRSTSTAVNRAAKKGDRVEVDFEVKVDGKVIEGGKSKAHPVVIGEKKFVPGFEEQLVGLKATDKKDFKLDFPKDYYQKKLAGKEAEFMVEVKSVQEVKQPELNDDFAKSVGKFKSLDELKKQIKHNLEHEKSHKEENRIEMAIVEKIAEKLDLELPEVLIVGEQKKMVQEMEQNMMQQGVPFTEYLKSINKTKEDLVKDQKDGAVKRVKISLILRQVADKEKVEISNQELEEELKKVKESFSKMYKGQESMAKQFDTPEYKEHLRSLMQNRKVFAKLKEVCATG